MIVNPAETKDYKPLILINNPSNPLAYQSLIEKTVSYILSANQQNFKLLLQNHKFLLNNYNEKILSNYFKNNIMNYNIKYLDFLILPKINNVNILQIYLSKFYNLSRNIIEKKINQFIAEFKKKRRFFQSDYSLLIKPKIFTTVLFNLSNLNLRNTNLYNWNLIISDNILITNYFFHSIYLIHYQNYQNKKKLNDSVLNEENEQSKDTRDSNHHHNTNKIQTTPTKSNNSSTSTSTSFMSADDYIYNSNLHNIFNANLLIFSLDNVRIKSSTHLRDHDTLLENHFKTTCVGGTFDHLHDGHKILLSTCSFLSSKSIVVGLSSKDLLSSKKYFNFLEPYQLRKDNIAYFLSKLKSNPNKKVDVKVFELNDICGPTLALENIDSLILTKETEKAGTFINNQRAEINFHPLKIHVVNLISDNLEYEDNVPDDFDLENDKLSSSQLRESDANQYLNFKLMLTNLQ
ncbi:uncharacterized protein ASCRUDRAFT_74835 [Ascoidea rubescens DSM 1968]|uniref:Cytidyltransferase-like domain-containing protein n=1 Tax=Ascoidea rubescens DSM 1968 TaxID=1344418 RepID=A0A1D2VLI9_9ASCO|nr:hypothetical protein ASCRUDRAFT_74835 [Ascoidea rubescens DSM 1968]ODV62469.1 hypothetical protein ASCRUDRAFT_74835 [Ascoidea rubescens DSM 1968]